MLTITRVRGSQGINPDTGEATLDWTTVTIEQSDGWLLDYAQSGTDVTDSHQAASRDAIGTAPVLRRIGLDFPDIVARDRILLGNFNEGAFADTAWTDDAWNVVGDPMGIDNGGFGGSAPFGGMNVRISKVTG